MSCRYSSPLQSYHLSNLSTEGIFCSGHVADHRSNVSNDCGEEENSGKHVEADIEVPEIKFDIELPETGIFTNEVDKY